MARRYRAEPIAVTMGRGGTGPDVPVGFRWRGRRYAVRVVLASWVEARPWWAGIPPPAEAGGQCPAQRQVWRVEAAPRAGMSGTYDLAWSPEGWTLDRVLD